jgi:hypothetical protein
VVLAPAVAHVLEDDVPPGLAPVADRREVEPVAVAAVPEVQHDRLARRQQREPVLDREQAVGIARVLGEREVRAVGLEELDRALDLVLELDLKLDGIGLEVDEAVMLV